MTPVYIFTFNMTTYIYVLMLFIASNKRSNFPRETMKWVTGSSPWRFRRQATRGHGWTMALVLFPLQFFLCCSLQGLPLLLAGLSSGSKRCTQTGPHTSSFPLGEKEGAQPPTATAQKSSGLFWEDKPRTISGVKGIIGKLTDHPLGPSLDLGDGSL